MSDTVISVENVSKIYRLGEVGTGSLAHDVNRWWHRFRGKDDPYLKVGQVNDRTKAAPKPSIGRSKSDDWVYALKDVSFEVKKGEVLGVIGRNGAGKSTLLKVLSRVTTQTSGHIKIKGRIASLLEVGTGFHPELTGRENVFLNGAILGMRRAEIASKFDEIVNFSGCARYIDTPVKRYSSGMYVRLAFAVAAHLDPEVLIVDEVLAVGDTEFQSKCLGKMRDIASSGRTVIFVTHTLPSVQRLCDSAIIMERGQIVLKGKPIEAISKYTNTSPIAKSAKHDISTRNEGNFEGFQFLSIGLTSKQNHPLLKTHIGQDFNIEIKFKISESFRELIVGMAIRTLDDTPIFATHNNDYGKTYHLSPGVYSISVPFSPNYLRQGQYYISLGAISAKVLLSHVSHALKLEVDSISENASTVIDDRIGILFIPMCWPSPRMEA